VKLSPLFDRVVLKRKAPETMRGGLHLPEKSAEKSNMAEVVAVGPGILEDVSRATHGGVNGDLPVYRPMSVKVGDTVLIGKWGGDLVTVDGVELLIVPEADILAVVETDILTDLRRLPTGALG
jgi:chaperonin GroES